MKVTKTLSLNCCFFRIVKNSSFITKQQIINLEDNNQCVQYICEHVNLSTVSLQTFRLTSLQG